MCTLTWLFDPRGYRVFFNRDERRTRKPALPPRRLERDGVAFLAPIDGDAGGTWLAVNAAGVTLALLNGYRPEGEGGEPARGDFQSRGLLVLSLADARELVEIERRVRARELGCFQPFLLAAFGPCGAARLFRWDGVGLQARDLAAGDEPLCTSSHDQAGAEARRRALLASWVRSEGEVTPDLLERFHRSHEPERGPYSPCLHREDAETVSYSLVRVGEREVRLEYSPGPPCARAPQIAASLSRTREARAY